MATIAGVAWAAVLMAMPASVLAQESPPLAPYVPPPSASPLAPLPEAGGTPAAAQDLGQVRLKSDTSSNISAADTRSPIAPALPSPGSSGDTAAAYLQAARAALADNQTGAAQEALERAESRALTRDVARQSAEDPSASPLVRAIEAARQALSVGNTEDAARDIGQAQQAE
jgi:hypothetical protein